MLALTWNRNENNGVNRDKKLSIMERNGDSNVMTGVTSGCTSGHKSSRSGSSSTMIGLRIIYNASRGLNNTNI